MLVYSENNKSTDLVSYMVIGERHDDEIKNLHNTDSDGRLITEVSKYGSSL